MNEIGEFLGQYATKEVLTVVSVLFAATIGWKAAKAGIGLIASVAKKASFLGLASAGLLAAGLGTTGFGIGELYSRPDVKDQNIVGLSNDDLLKIISKENASPELVKAILEYAKNRDKGTTQNSDLIAKNTIPASYDQQPYEEITIDPVKEAASNAEESMVSLPIAWALIGLGIASSIAGVTVYGNRNQRRNVDDPHHPNFESQYKRT